MGKRTHEHPLPARRSGTARTEPPARTLLGLRPDPHMGRAGSEAEAGLPMLVPLSRASGVPGGEQAAADAAVAAVVKLIERRR